MNDRRDDLMDESVLRRAMRLEADERAPRFDPRAIALMATDRTLPGWTTLTAIAGVVVMGAVAVSVWSVIIAFAPEILDTVMGAVVAVAVPALTLLEPVAGIAAQPVIPLSLLAALVVAILNEVRERRERLHVNAP
jgi:hypothetical protein